MNAPTQSYAGILGPGKTLPVSLTGQFFYIPVATAPIFVRPTGGTWCQYQPGTGDHTAGFAMLEIYNPNANAVTFQIIAGSREFIDKRVIPWLQVSNVIKPAAWTGAVQFTAEMPDLSGQPFDDISGNLWLAIARVSMTCQLYQQLAAGGGPSSLFAYSGLFTGNDSVLFQGKAFYSASFNIPASPPFTVQAVGPLSVFVDPNGWTTTQTQACTAYEIYQAVAPGYAGQPPG